VPNLVVVDVAAIETKDHSNTESTSTNLKLKHKVKADLLTPRRRSVRLNQKLNKAPHVEDITIDTEVRGSSKPSRKKLDGNSRGPNKENTVHGDDSVADTVEGRDDDINSEKNSHPVTKSNNEDSDATRALDTTDILAELNSTIINSSNKTSSTGENLATINAATQLAQEKNKELDKKYKMTEKNNNSDSTTSRLGRIKSGRFWKSERDRFRSTIKSKGLKQVSSQKRIAQKQQILRVREYEKSLKEDVKRLREEKKQRTEENKKRRVENEKKNEIVQVIKNPAKIKRMKKKQLRMLAKRDVTIV